jgi:hypothetical protein
VTKIKRFIYSLITTHRIRLYGLKQKTRRQMKMVLPPTPTIDDYAQDSTQGPAQLQAAINTGDLGYAEQLVALAKIYADQKAGTEAKKGYLLVVRLAGILRDYYAQQVTANPSPTQDKILGIFAPPPGPQLVADISKLVSIPVLAPGATPQQTDNFKKQKIYTKMAGQYANWAK